MRAGRAIRQAQRLEAADARACDECAHPMGEHFEIGYGVEGHVAGTFHCKREGCNCAVALTSKPEGE